MDKETQEVMFSSDSSEWRTPLWLFQALDEEFDFVIDLAATEENALCADFFTKEDDALAQSWVVGGACYCNPPYGREVGKWVQKARDEAAKGATIVMLLPVRTDTAWFHDFIKGQTEIRFLRGRLRFLDPDGLARSAAPFPSMICIWRPSHCRTGN